MTNVYLEAALAYAAKGWHVFPTDITKKPYTHHGFKDASTDPDQIKRWWAQWSNAGIGVATGAVSGFWVLDIDPRHGGDLTLKDLLTEHGLMDDTLLTRTCLLYTSPSPRD